MLRGVYQMKPQEEAPAAGVECYSFNFPASDPGSVAAYATVVRALFDFEIPGYAKDWPFAGEAQIFSLPDVMVSWVRSGASRLTRTAQMLAREGTDQILVVCYRSGSWTMESGGRTQRVEAGELGFVDLSKEVIIEAAAVENSSLAISRRKLEALVPFLNDAHCFVRPNGPLPHLLVSVMDHVRAHGASMPLADSRAIADTIIQLSASCLEPLAHRRGAGGATAVPLVAIKAGIEQKLLDPHLSPKSLLEEFGMTRSTLYRLFEPLGGVTAYITERRLHYALRILADPLQSRRRISQLAFDLGFSHASAFTRAFKDLFGLSPKDARALSAHARPRDAELKATPEVMALLSPIRDSNVRPQAGAPTR
jgi:AraC-like DNA-binding protein